MVAASNDNDCIHEKNTRVSPLVAVDSGAEKEKKVIRADDSNDNAPSTKCHHHSMWGCNHLTFKLSTF